MSEPCDGCHDEATHYLCDDCINDDVNMLQSQLRSADAKVEHLLIALKEVQKALRVSDPAAIREADDLIDQVLEEYKP